MHSRWIAVLVSALAFGAGVLVGAPTIAHSQTGGHPWATEGAATVHPGVMLVTEGSQCTANFVFTDGPHVYLGTAAHCASTSSTMETNGCEAGSLPLDTPVEIQGASRPGRLVYSSWLAMQATGEQDGRVCHYNDFALVYVDPADVPRINPTVPHWGGPEGVKAGPFPAMAPIYGYGNSSLRLGIQLLAPKSGASLGTDGDGWTHPAYTVTPGIPGDSGGGMLDASGQAGGVLSTITLWPLALSNNYTDLRMALDYLRSHGGPQIRLVPGTRPFDGSQAPLAL